MSLPTHSLDLEKSSSQYASITDASQTGLDLSGDFTIEAWIKTEDDSASLCIASKYDRNSLRSYRLFIDTGSAFNIDVSDDGSSDTGHLIRLKAETIVSVPGEWQHIAVTFDISTETAVFYLNGIQYSSTLEIGTTLGAALYDTSTDFAIGTNFNSGVDLPFDGLITNLAVFSDIRTQSEVLSDMYDESLSDINLVGYWKLDNDYTDETTNGNDLTSSGSPTFSTNTPWTKIIFEDYFTEGGNPDLENHTPDIGNSWTKIETINSGGLIAYGALNQLRSNGTGTSKGSLYTADITYPNNYYASMTMTYGDSADDTNTIAVRIQDEDNYYAVRFNTQVFQLYKVVGGTATALGSAQGAVASNGDTIKLEIDGTTLTAYINGSSQQSETVTDHSSAGKAGVGMGANVVVTDDQSAQQLDDFRVEALVDPNATGGDISYDGDDIIHTFNSGGTFTPDQSLSVDYIVVAGGGSGGSEGVASRGSGGGGAGGYRPGTSHSVTAINYTITVGNGGTAPTGDNVGDDGDDSVFDSITSTGGGGGGQRITDGRDGGSGGGANDQRSGGAALPVTSPVQGYAGQSHTNFGGGSGGGGASETPTAGSGSDGGDGGDGISNSISGTATYYSGGGGGGAYSTGASSSGGLGGGGNGGGDNHATEPQDGTANTGGGGGGAYDSTGTGGDGGSGIVIIRYEHQSPTSQVTKTHTTDSYLESGAVEKTHTTDSHLVDRNTLTHTTDSYLQSQEIVVHTTDSLLKDQVELNQDTDSYLQSQIEKTHTTDSYLIAEFEITHDADSYLQGRITLANTTDSYLDQSGFLTHTTDSTLQREVEFTHTTDSYMSTVAQVEKTHDADSYLQAEKFKAHSTDSYLQGRVEITHNTDSYLSGTKEVAHSTDSFIQIINDIQHTTDSLLFEEIENTHTTDSYVNYLILKQHSTDTFTLGSIFVAHTTDAILSENENDTYLYTEQGTTYTYKYTKKGTTYKTMY
ncbi:MAG: LamG domain-containing protein [Candidatus Heimdallarchaeaceae archaeon]